MRTRLWVQEGKRVLAAVALGCGLCCGARAMDRWEALSQIETGDNDTAVGAAGEVSRYQLKPEVWKQHASPTATWTRAEDALVVAQAVMKERCAEFERWHGRPPTDFEFYVLWNAPAQVDSPSAVVRERAERYCNLVARPKDEPQP